jgi:O-antigen/teichoic acid export membrane protein
MVAISRARRVARRLASEAPVASFAYLAAATAASLLNSLVIAVAFARLAGSSAFGVYRTALAATSLIAFIALSGSAGAAQRAAAQGRSAAWPLFRQRLPYCLVGSGVAGVIAAVLALKGAKDAAIAFVVVASTLPLFLGTDVYPAELLGRADYHRYFKFQLSLQATTVAGVLAALLARPHDPWLALLAFTMITGLLQLQGLIRVREGARADAGDTTYARGMSVIALLGTASSRIDVLLVSVLLGVHEAGLVAVARLFPMFLKQMWAIPYPWFLTTMARDGGAAASFVARRYRLVVAGTLAAMSAVGVIVAPFAVPAFFGADFTSAVPLTQLLLASAAIGPLAFLDEVALRALGELRRLGVVYVAQPVVTLVTMPVLVVAFGIVGVGISAIASSMTYVIVLRFVARGRDTEVAAA